MHAYNFLCSVFFYKLRISRVFNLRVNDWRQNAFHTQRWYSELDPINLTCLEFYAFESVLTAGYSVRR